MVKMWNHYGWGVQKLWGLRDVKLPRKGHSNEADPSRITKNNNNKKKKKKKKKKKRLFKYIENFTSKIWHCKSQVTLKLPTKFVH